MEEVDPPQREARGGARGGIYPKIKLENWRKSRLADHYIMERQYKDIYQSYLDVCESLFKAEGRVFSPPDDGTNFEESEEADSEDETPEAERTSALTVFTKAQFSNALQRLKNSSHGSVIESPKEQRGWYRFSIPMLRGYCRIVAARQGVHIGLQYLDSKNRLVKEQPSATTWPKPG